MPAAFLLAGCVDEMSAPENFSEGFIGTIEDFTDQTRTSLAEGNYIAWSDGDRIAVFQGSVDPDCFEVSDASAGKTRASFEAVSLEGSTGSGVVSSHKENLALYPYSEGAYCKLYETSQGNAPTYMIGSFLYPQNQTYASGSFPADALVMAAVTESLSDKNLKFKAASAVLRFKVKGSTSLKSIKVIGNYGESLAGEGEILLSADSGIKSVTVYSGKPSVTLDCGKGVALDESEATVFMLCIPPTDFDEGFTVTFTDTEGVEDVRTVSKSISVKQGHIFGMSEITFGQAYEPSGEYDYVDEYGINHGPGVEIDGVVWAPVNCGYHKTDFKYGKLYQWGRKYGQGYDGDLYDINGNKTGTYTDAAVPTVKDGPVSLSTGQSESNEDYFYKNDSEPWDWLSSPNDYLWRIGFESRLIKTEYDPCPEGWRVPTYAEFEALAENKSSWATDSKGQVGYWFSGSKPYSSSVPRVFFPAAGRRDYYDGKAYDRGLNGYYWSSVSDVGFSYYFYLLDYGAYLGGFNRGCGSSVRCVKDDAGLVSVTSVSLNESSFAIGEGDTFTLSATISPSDANHKSAHWWSDDESVATVDQTGKVAAVSAGTATITAMAGMKTTTCRVTVMAASSGMKDYVDEYGINHGSGVEIDGVVWAPVNCGYHKTDFKYGKLYQWGRKYGQGYDGYDSATTNLLTGPVSLPSGQSEVNTWNFYLSTESINDWLYPQNNSLWNNGTEDNPIKTEYDPCPDGWRVPTDAELKNLIRNGSSMTSSGGKAGYWFTGSNPYKTSAVRLFLTMSGGRNYDKGNVYGRGNQYGLYWSSDIEGDKALRLCLASDYVVVGPTIRSLGITVRCVQDDGVLVPVTSVTLDKSSVIMDEGDTYTLSASISPSDANHQSAYWWSDDESVATVDQTGVVTAVSAGTTSITAMVGMQTTTCTVTVKGQAVAQEGDYVDEYGINHGQGVEIDGVVWAPVNCGYHKDDFKYGKLYQWGRKYGQGYEGSLYDMNGNYVSAYLDASSPKIKYDSVNLIDAQSQANANNFYASNDAPYNWADALYDALWNANTEDDPLKSEYDPCPDGWRVPTHSELSQLVKNYEWGKDVYFRDGYWFSGSATYSLYVPQVFLITAGQRSFNGGAMSRGYSSSYWTSGTYSNFAFTLNFDVTFVSMGYLTRASAYPVRCVKDDGELVPVTSVSLNKSSVTMDEGDTFTLSATISPSDANHQSAHWWSDDESVATVDQSGKVTAVSAGTATITAMAGMKTATCQVTVKDQSVAQEGDYIDEYGVNHGQGVEIGGVVWAPVNCGYHKTDFKYGKLYQWGRKYGQGYDGASYDVSGNYVGTYTDATIPTVKSGPVSLSTGQSESNEDYFYKNTSYPYNWLSSPDVYLWNNGTEDNPVKTEYDPCPEGWRVPTYAELNNLSDNYSGWTTSDDLIGRWFSGSSSYSDSVPRLFLPATGFRKYSNGNASSRGLNSVYWSSRPLDDGAYVLYFYSSNVTMGSYYRADGDPVRCVQE